MPYQNLIGKTVNSRELQKWGFSEPILSFLEFNKIEVNVTDTWKFHFKDIVKDHPKGSQLKRSKFLNCGESNFYSQLVTKGLRHYSERPINKVFDLGCGSSVPTLGAICTALGKDGSFIGVDIDPEAIEISRLNSEILGLKDRCQFVLKDMNTFMSDFDFNCGHILVAANPPYVPTPPNLMDSYFEPISGGIDGLRYLRPILKNNFNKGTLVVLVAGSFSSPLTLIEEIASSFKILKVEAYLNRFGPYTSHENLLPYLLDLRKQGKITFGQDEEGIRLSLVFGFILERN